jgi:hypothetical protein
MLRAVASFRRGDPVHTVVSEVRTAYLAAEKCIDEANVDVSVLRNFIVLRMYLGDLLLRVAKKWGSDITVKIAPTLHAEPVHVMEAARQYLSDARECCTGTDTDLAPKLDAIMAQHGMIAA